MILKNKSNYDTAKLRELAVFASHGIGHTNVELHINNSSSSLRGRCFYRPFNYRVVITSIKIRNLITIKLPVPDKIPKNTWNHVKRIKKLWPDGIPFEDWHDATLFVLAHEFRHVWQNKNKKTGKCEYDAEKFAHQRLNKWRETTGRQPIQPIKQPNPFQQKEETNERQTICNLDQASQRQDQDQPSNEHSIQPVRWVAS